MKTSKTLFEGMTEKYPIARTLRIGLKPVGKTEQYVEAGSFLKEDKEKERAYKKVKKILDDLHRDFMNRVFAQMEDIDWKPLANAYQNYWSHTSEEAYSKELEITQEKYRKLIVKYFKANEDYKCLSNDNLFKKLIPKYLKNKSPQYVEESKSVLRTFDKFHTYFQGYYENRKNLYVSDGESTAIAYRIVNENFPKYLTNCLQMSELKHKHPRFYSDCMESLNSKILKDYVGEDAALYFEIERYFLVLSQKGINKYNLVLGGDFFKENSRVKTKGLNELLNQGYQQHSLPKKMLFQPLYKQMLSNVSKEWQIKLESFANNQEIWEAISSLFDGLIKSGEEEHCIALFNDIHQFDITKIYLSKQKMYSFSKYVLEDPNKLVEDIQLCALNEYAIFSGATNKQKETISNKSAWSLYELKEIVESVEENKEMAFTNLVKEMNDKLSKSKELYKELINKKFSEEKKLLQNEKMISILKAFLDSQLGFLRLAEMFDVSEDFEKNQVFYTPYNELLKRIRIIVPLYNKIRNYCTKKPYSIEKFRLTFNHPTFLGGWQHSKLSDYGAFLLKDEKSIYLGVLPKNSKNTDFIIEAKNGEDAVFIMNYSQFQDPNRMIPKCAFTNIVKEHFKHNQDSFFLKKNSKGEIFEPPLEISKTVFDVYSSGKYKRAYLSEASKVSSSIEKKKIEEEYKKAFKIMKEFYLRFLKSYPSTRRADHSSIEKKEYRDLNDLAANIEKQLYSLTFTPVSKNAILKAVENGEVLLWRLYNKDFSPNSKGTKNLHTLYLLAALRGNADCFNPIKLNGEAEMFFRPKSINNPFEHKKGDILINKTYSVGENNDEIIPIPDNVYLELKENIENHTEEKLTGEAKRLWDSGKVIIKKADYPLIKDRRFSENHYELHIPITLSFGTKGLKTNALNQEIVKKLITDESINIIGIDRGERNLLEVSVINQKGKILKQKSLNIASNNYDYWKKLDNLEKERKTERRSWKSITNIKNAKKGYLSSVINEITKMALEYNAILVMEDLNWQFKRLRTKIEKQVYQGFEGALINKLNYCVFKDVKDPKEAGSVEKGYQLSGIFEGFDKLFKQSGIIFYVYPSYTSHIDPTTGFCNLFGSALLRYGSIQKTKDFFSKMKKIQFNEAKDYFEFEFVYKDFKVKNPGRNVHWKACSWDCPRIIGYKNKHTNKWETRTLNINEELKDLFESYDVDYKSADFFTKELFKPTEAYYYKELLFLFKSLVQLRYSEPSYTEEKRDIIISPIKNKDGFFYSSDEGRPGLPMDGDSNGAYHIALKGLMMLEKTKEKSKKTGKTDKLVKISKPITEWLNYVQKDFEE